MKKTILIIMVISAITFAQRFGASIGTETYAGYDDFSPKHLTGHFYLPLNDKFSFDFSAGIGLANYETETDFEDAGETDTKNTVKISGANVEVGLFYTHKFQGSAFEPFAGLGLGIYSYTRTEEAENFESEAVASGLGQFITFGLNMKVSEKFTAFVQFKKLGASFISVTEDYDHDNNNRDAEIVTDYSAKPGTQDLGISAGIKFSF